MKKWHQPLLWILIGMALFAVMSLVAAPPRGTSVVLQPAPTPGPILVYVDGAVQKPGVYQVSRDARVQDAVKAAGGFSSQASPAGMNLAARLKDGEKISIPTAGTPPAASQPPVGEPASRVEKVPVEGTPTAPVNLNTATIEALQTLPGIGPARAQQIIDYRQSHGGFQSIDEIQNVSGIGPATFERLKEIITVD